MYTAEYIYTFWYSVANDEVSSTSSEIVEQIEDIQEVDMPGMYLSWKSALGNRETKKGFLQKKTLGKGRLTWYYLLYSVWNQLMDRVIE